MSSPSVLTVLKRELELQSCESRPFISEKNLLTYYPNQSAEDFHRFLCQHLGSENQHQALMEQHGISYRNMEYREGTKAIYFYIFWKISKH